MRLKKEKFFNKFPKFVIATRNLSKKERYSLLAADFAEEVLDLNDLGITEKPEESGNTAEENAEIKARFYSQKTGLPCFCEDEALYVDFLPENKQPGIFVRRLDGKDHASDDELLAYWENIIAKVPEGDRTGWWHIAYSIATPDGKVKTVALDHPVVFFSPSSGIRLPGWPMSSLLGSARFNKPHSELNDNEHKTSDRDTNQEISKVLNRLLCEG